MSAANTTLPARTWPSGLALGLEITGGDPAMIAYCLSGEDHLVTGLWGLLTLLSDQPLSLSGKAGHNIRMGVCRLHQNGKITAQQKDFILGANPTNPNP